MSVRVLQEENGSCSQWPAPCLLMVHATTSPPPHACCRRANVAGGVPQTTDCSIHCNSGGGSFTMLSVVGYRGDPAATTLTDLQTFSSDPFLSQE